MTRLEFAAAALLLATPAVATATVSVDAEYADAAQRLFAVDAERETFLYRLSRDPGLAADVLTALRAAKAAGGGDAAVTAKLKADPAAGDWVGAALGDLVVARKTLETGLDQKPPKTVYPDSPLIARLVSGLHKKDAPELFAAINKPEYGGPQPFKAATTPAKPCVPAATAFAQLKAQAGGADALDGGPCVQAPTANADPKTSAGPGGGTAAGLLNGSARNLSDLRPANGAPPAPGAGSDKGAADPGKGGSWFSSMFSGESIARAGLLGAFGALIGSAAGPLGMIVGGLLGAVAGFLLKGGGDGGGASAG